MLLGNCKTWLASYNKTWAARSFSSFKKTIKRPSNSRKHGATPGILSAFPNGAPVCVYRSFQRIRTKTSGITGKRRSLYNSSTTHSCTCCFDIAHEFNEYWSYLRSESFIIMHSAHLSLTPPFSWSDISPVRFDPGEGNPAEECRHADGRQMLENIWKQLVRPSC